MRCPRLRSILALGTVVAIVTMSTPGLVPHALGREDPYSICPPEGPQVHTDIGQPGPDGWTSDQETLADSADARRYLFTVESKGTLYVYIGDQPYGVKFALSTLKAGADPSCWKAVRLTTVNEPEGVVFESSRSRERNIEVEPGIYVLSVRPADSAAVDPSRTFTVRIAVGPRVCALEPANVPDPQYPGMTVRPDLPDRFQIGLSFQPDAAELGPFTLMTFSVYLSPPYADLFEYIWEVDGQAVPGASSLMLQLPYARLPHTPLGLHTVKVTLRGVREYRSPIDPRYDFLPFDGGSRSVACRFRGPV
jgi:hypothetical protein